MRRTHGTFRTDLTALLPRLRRFGYALAGNAADGDDLVQDALEKALKREDQFQPGTRLDSWMYRIIQTTWIDKTRADKRKRKVFTAMDGVERIAGEDGRRTFDTRIQLSKAREAMDVLSEDERAVLTLVAIEEFTYRETAETLEIPIGTVMSRVARAHSKLAATLATEDPKNDRKEASK